MKRPVPIATLTLLVGLAGCVARLPIQGAVCPCPLDYCCVDGKSCAPKLTPTCPPTELPAGADAAGSRDAAEDLVTTGAAGAGPSGRDGASEVADAADASSPDVGDAGGLDGPTCSAPVTPLCADGPPDGEPCNPTCQTGCTCGHRCAVSNGHALCLLNYGHAKPGDLCAPMMAAGHVAEDQCEPGSVCLREPCGGLARCYRVCESKDQCAGRNCVIPVETYAPNLATSFTACELPPRACDPIRQTGCPSSSLECYPFSDGTTGCECPTAAQPLNASCTLFSDCFAGLVCIAGVSGNSNPTCQRACDTLATPSCQAGMCVPINASSRWGVCEGP